jgi:hypothetical protein
MVSQRQETRLLDLLAPGQDGCEPLITKDLAGVANYLRSLEQVLQSLEQGLTACQQRLREAGHLLNPRPRATGENLNEAPTLSHHRRLSGCLQNGVPQLLCRVDLTPPFDHHRQRQVHE